MNKLEFLNKRTIDCGRKYPATERVQKELDELRNRFLSDFQEVHNLAIGTSTMVREFRELTETTAAKVSRLTADVNQRLNDIGVH